MEEKPLRDIKSITQVYQNEILPCSQGGFQIIQKYDFIVEYRNGTIKIIKHENFNFREVLKEVPR